MEAFDYAARSSERDQGTTAAIAASVSRPIPICAAWLPRRPSLMASNRGGWKARSQRGPGGRITTFDP
jgi:hypothetical protein